MLGYPQPRNLLSNTCLQITHERAVVFLSEESLLDDLKWEPHRIFRRHLKTLPSHLGRTREHRRPYSRHLHLCHPQVLYLLLLLAIPK